MGLLHVLVLRALYNTATIIISDPLQGRRDLALQLGVSGAISPEELPGGDHRGVTDGFDAVFDTVGRPEIVQSALELTREGGSMILFAHGRPDDRLDLAMNSLFKSERRLIGTYSGGPGEQQRAWNLLASGRLDPSPLVTHHLPLDAFEMAVTLARDLKAIKVLLFPRGDTDAVA